jgi:peptidoglycan hydrolase-like protein with peptidoglycan-binding domain
MKLNFTAAGMFLLVMAMGASVPFARAGHAQPATAASGQDQDPVVTSGLVREIQTMLRRLGLNPGPVDGMPSTRTNRAVRVFEERHNLPFTELKRYDTVPAEFLARLRDEAAAPSVLGRAGKATTVPQTLSPPVAPVSRREEQPTPKTVTDAVAAPSLPGRAGKADGPETMSAPLAPASRVEEQPAPKTATDAVAPPPVESPPRKIAASCTYDPEDFHIGANRYTPDTFLKEGFDGSTANAVFELKDRLEEGRQIADRIGVSALPEVQRQARVLHYFECRLKIEQAANKN